MSAEHPDDPDLRAAEYVLGTLPAEARAAFARDLAADPGLAARVADWERRLAPLALCVPPVAPPADAWEAIARRLSPAEAANDNRVAALSAQLRRWRLATAGAGLVAAGLALFVAAGLRAPAPDSRYVAVVTSGGDLPALIVSVDTRAGTAQVRPVAAQAPAGRSLELWYVGTGKAPKTLGLLGERASRITLPEEATARGEGVIAVSVEPPGGSPTGQPTGQVIYTGKLIRE